MATNKVQSNNKEKLEALSSADLTELKEVLKQQILEELKDEQHKKEELAKKIINEDQKKKNDFIESMKGTSTPWVDIFGWADDEHGIKAEMEWNEGFINYAKNAGITGADENTIVHKCIIILLRQIAEDIDREFDNETSEYE